MITNGLIIVLDTFLASLIQLLPNSTPLPPNIHTAVITIQPYVNMLNTIMPIDTIFQVVLCAFIFETSVLAFKIMNFIFNKVRGSG